MVGNCTWRWRPLDSLSRAVDSRDAADNEAAPALIYEVPSEMRFLLGDRRSNAPNVRKAWENDERILVASQYGRYPHMGGGVEVRRVFHITCVRARL